jgi:hypothetical protein
MNANDVLIDLLSDNQCRLHRVMDAMNDDCLYGTPDPEASCIVVTVWHMGRLLDVFLTRYAQEKEAGKKAWFSRGWAERTGYDPWGLGRDGWGSANDYTRQEVAAILPFSQQDLSGYSDDVADRVTGFLSETRTEELLQAGAGFGGTYTRYQLIQMPLLDNVRHLGEVFALTAMWERRAGHAEA